MMNTYNELYKVFNTNNGMIISKVIATSTSGLLLHKPQFLNYNEEEEMIYLTDVFEGLSVSTEYFISYSQILFSGLPDPQLITMYQRHIGESSEDDEEQQDTKQIYH